MHRTNLLIYVAKANISGATRICLDIERLLDPDRFNVFLVFGASGDGADNVFANLRRQGVNFAVLQRLPWSLTRRFRLARFVEAQANRFSFRRLVRRFKPDIVYVNTVRVPDYVLATRNGTRLIYHLHFQILPAGIRGVGQQHIPLLNRADRVFAASRPLADRLIAAGVSANLVSTKLSAIVPPPVNLENRRIYRRKLNYQHDDLVVAGSGAATHRKGPDLFLRMAEQIVAQPGTENIKFLWVGGGGVFDGFGKPDLVTSVRVSQARLGDRFQFTGMVDNSINYYQAVDVFVMCSRAESCVPRIMMETMALQKSVVAFGIGGVVESLQDGAILVEPENADALSQSVLRLIFAPDERERLGKLARARILADFDLAKLVRSLEKEFEELCAVQN